MATPLKLPKLFLRLVKGAPLTATEGDHNIKSLRDFGNQLAALMSEALNPDGTLKNASVAKAFMPFFAYFLLPLGSVRWSLNVEPASVTAPASGAWWLEANGQEVLITDYQKLYDFYQANGFVFGEPATAGKFRLPDLQGRFQVSRKEASATQKSISSIVRVGDVATATKLGHGFSAGQKVEISGCDQGEYNGLFTIESTTNSTFAFVVSGEPASPATGVIVATVQSGGLTAGEFGGEDEVILRDDQIPAHAHLLATGENYVGSTPKELTSQSSIAVVNDGRSTEGAKYFGYRLIGSDEDAVLGKSSKVGGGLSHNNMPPYAVGVAYVLAGYKIDGEWVGAPTF